MTFTYRPAELDDERFIISGWSSSYRLSRDIGFIQMDRYAETMHAIVRSVLARPRVRTLVADGAVMPRVGFLCFEPSEVGALPIVMYLFVAQPYRRRGVARGLFRTAGIDPLSPFHYACRTQASWELRRKVPSARFNPLRARFAEEENAHVAEEDRQARRVPVPVVEHRRGGGVRSERG